MPQINKAIDCKIIAERIKDQVVAEVLKIEGRRPSLAIILVGEREDSKLYVSLKEREAKEIGIDTHVYRCAAETPETEIFAMIDFLNKDDAVDAILVQLPMPAGFDTDGIILAIDPQKDVDRFHPDNLEKFFHTCNNNDVMPPVIKVVLRILDEVNFDLRGKIAGVLANSDIFGKSLAKALECRGAEARLIKADDPDLFAKSSACDVLATAVGKAQFVRKEMVKKDAIVIDIGITKENGKVHGDVDYDDVMHKAAYVTPVPGGVGPLTIGMLFENVLELYKRNKEKG